MNKEMHQNLYIYTVDPQESIKQTAHSEPVKAVTFKGKNSEFIDFGRIRQAAESNLPDVLKTLIQQGFEVNTAFPSG